MVMKNIYEVQIMNMFTYIHTYTHTHTHTHTYIHTCMHTYIHTYIHTYMHTCMHACVNCAKRKDTFAVCIDKSSVEPAAGSDLILHSAEWSTQAGYVMVFAPYLRSTT